MLSSQVAEAASKLSGKGESAVFFDAVNTLTNVVDDFLSEARKQAKSPQSLNIQHIFSSAVRQATRTIDLWNLYESTQIYLRDLDESNEKLLRSTHVIEFVESEVHKFLERYKSYMADQNFENAFDLAMTSKEVARQVGGFSLAMDLFSSGLEPEVAVGSDECEITIFSTSDIDRVDDLGKMLSSVVSIYNQLCDLLGESSDEHPLTVIKVETGSIYLKLKGAIRVVGVVTQVLRRIAGYGFLNHTLSGRINQLPKSAESLQSIIQLRESLSRLGIDTSSMDEEIEGATLKLAKHANTLMSRMGDVGINGEVFQAKNDVFLALGQDVPQRLIGHEDE